MNARVWGARVSGERARPRVPAMTSSSSRTFSLHRKVMGVGAKTVSAWTPKPACETRAVPGSLVPLYLT